MSAAITTGTDTGDAAAEGGTKKAAGSLQRLFFLHEFARICMNLATIRMNPAMISPNQPTISSGLKK
jgi:hypothetical protein